MSSYNLLSETQASVIATIHVWTPERIALTDCLDRCLSRRELKILQNTWFSNGYDIVAGLHYSSNMMPPKLARVRLTPLMVIGF
ncbi:hypothetical protein GE21DRAFT_1283544 [Neurospora crassa]|nr:hypothetical protein GE21DRAFT_1283544 [Neurospora crassa]